ncbi:MAG: hypothetical protein QXT26_03925 [Thermoproteota archaeon]
MVTGVFFHPRLVGEEWPIIGDRYRNFPRILSELAASNPNLKLIQPDAVSEELLLRIHTRSHIEGQRGTRYYEGARIAVGGLVKACELVYSGQLQNAVVFNVAAGHHAHRDYAWGGTYLSAIGPALIRLRELDCVRVAYLDTDSHHGDGDREILSGDPNAIHICFCSSNSIQENGTKVCIDVGWSTTDQDYLDKVSRTLEMVRKFKPQIIIHFFGHDTYMHDYGSRGLTLNFFPKLAEMMLRFSQEVCGGRYVVMDGGGADRDATEYIWTQMLKILSTTFSR